MIVWVKKPSKIDSSVNFISKYKESIIECRYVRRKPEQVTVYLSSHNGCKMACRFCHLTASHQNKMDGVTTGMFPEQAEVVLNYWEQHERTGQETTVNFNWMARGEPLLNSNLITHWPMVKSSLEALANKYSLQPVFNISTIIPDTFDKSLVAVFYPIENVRIYWSLYSVNPKFRKRWLAKAMAPEHAASLLRRWQKAGGKIVLHNAFIAGENDSPVDINALSEFLIEHELTDSDFNIVRYNPYSDKHGQESPEERLQEISEEISRFMTGRVQLVPRVGFDVNASCGMFETA